MTVFFKNEANDTILKAFGTELKEQLTQKHGLRNERASRSNIQIL
jgi:hypothetical protein